MKGGVQWLRSPHPHINRAQGSWGPPQPSTLLFPLCPYSWTVGFTLLAANTIRSLVTPESTCACPVPSAAPDFQLASSWLAGFQSISVKQSKNWTPYPLPPQSCASSCVKRGQPPVPETRESYLEPPLSFTLQVLLIPLFSLTCTWFSRPLPLTVARTFGGRFSPSGGHFGNHRAVFWLLLLFLGLWERFRWPIPLIKVKCNSF